MREYLNKLPKEILDLIYLARDIASRNHMPAYLVGGFVRDLLLGVKNLDLDIVVEGSGIKFAEDFAKHLKASLISHARFGTATIIISYHLKVDIASARKEAYPQPAQLPEVRRGSLKEDLFRRDFTINAMAVSLDPKKFGRLIDGFGGKMDLGNKKIRILHSKSFVDDPTRILRAIRFEKRYNFNIEPKTLKSLKEAVKFKMLEKVQPQRVRDDLILMLKEEHPLKEIKRLRQLAGFGFIHPRLSVSEDTYNLIRSIGKQVYWFKRAYPKRRHLDIWLVYLMGLLDAVDINLIRNICARFAFRKGEKKRILDYKKSERRLILALNRKRVKPSRIFSLLEPLSYEAIILLKAKHKNGSIQKHIEDFLEIYNGMHISSCGDDLRKLGIKPGPDYQKIFTRVLNAKLNGLLKTREEELALINKLIKVR